MVKKYLLYILIFLSLFAIIGTVSAIDTADINVQNRVENLTTYSWATNAQYNYNDTSYYIAKVTNNGPNTANNVQISNPIPSGLTLIDWYVRFPGGNWICNDTSFNPATGLWNVGTLVRGQSASLNYQTYVTGSNTNIYTTASRIENGYYVDPNPTNDQSSAITQVPAAAHVTITNTASSNSPNYYTPVTFTITAKNNGPDTATGLRITDLLPTGLTYKSHTTTLGTYTSETGDWNLGSLASGASATLTLVANVTQTGQLVNWAKTTAQDQYDNIGYDSKLLTLTVPLSADIQVNQNANSTNLNAGNLVNFSIITKNNGPDCATGVQVISKVPTGFIVLSWKVSRDGGATWTPGDSSYSSSTGVWNIGNLTNGATYLLDITANATAMGNFTNNATKTAETEYDWDTTNDAQSVNLTVTGTVPPNIFTNQGSSGGTVNSDDGTTTAITLPFPITLYGQTFNTIYISVNGAVGLGNPILGPYYYVTPEQNANNANVAYLAPFWADFDVTYLGNITYTITSNMVNITWNKVPGFSQNTNPNMVNTVSLIMTNDGKFAFVYGDLTWKNDPNDSYPSYARIRLNSTTFKNFWTGAQALSLIANKTIWFDSNGNIIDDPHIALTYTVNNSTPNYYDNVVYTIIATNEGPDTATGVKITALLPSGLTYVSSSSTAYNSVTGIWNVGSLTNGASTILNIIAKVNQTGSITTSAATTAQDQYDPNPYDSKSLTINVPKAADIAVTQTSSSATPTWNNNVILRITVTNNGPDIANNVQITSQLPLALLYQSHTLSQGTYEYMTGIWNVGSLASGQSRTLNLTCKVMGAGTIINWANKTAETEYDWNLINDNISTTLTVATPTVNQADVAVTQTASKTSLIIGETVTITIRVRNNGPTRADAISVTNLLPAGLTYISHTATTGTYRPSTGVWSIGNINRGTTRTLTITARATQVGNITNLARKTAQTTYDPVLTNDLQAITYSVSTG